MKSKPLSKFAVLLFACIGLVIFAGVAVVIGLAVSANSNYQTQAKAETNALASIQLPAGYSVTGRRSADEGGPVGNTPHRIEDILVPAGKTRTNVVNDFNTIAPSKQHVVNDPQAYDNDFSLVINNSLNVEVLNNPYTDPDQPQPAKAVSNLQITASN